MFIKPYHTKILGVEVVYTVSETMNVSMTEELFIHTNVGLVFEEVQWDYPNIELGNLPINQLVDGVYASFIEELNVKTDFVDVPIDVPYNYDTNRWDVPYNGFLIVGVLPNGFIVKGNVAAILQTQPGFEFEVWYSDDYSGMYICDNAVYENSLDITNVYVLGSVTLPTEQLVSYGLIKLGLWDAVGWDGDNPPPDEGPGTMSVNTKFNESLMISEGFGWDDPRQGGWDATDGTYTGTTDDDYHNPSYWSNPCEWDQGFYLINGSTINNPRLEVLGWDNTSLGGWDSDAVIDVLPENGTFWIQEPIPNTTTLTPGWDENRIVSYDLTVNNMNESQYDTSRRVVFAHNDVPNPYKLRKIHDQVTPSTVWLLDVSKFYDPQVITYDMLNQQIEWINIERPNPHTIVITFDVPQSGYVLGV